MEPWWWWGRWGMLLKWRVGEGLARKACRGSPLVSYISWILAGSYYDSLYPRLLSTLFWSLNTMSQLSQWVIQTQNVLILKLCVWVSSKQNFYCLKFYYRTQKTYWSWSWFQLFLQERAEEHRFNIYFTGLHFESVRWCTNYEIWSLLNVIPQFHIESVKGSFGFLSHVH